VHHVDLGLGYRATDWPEAYVSLELPGALETLADRVEDHEARVALLSWLYGRGSQPSLDPAPWQSRADYYHRTL
jgi:hypothetical protein